MVEMLKEWLSLWDAVPVEVRIALASLLATHFVKRNILPARYRTARVIESVSVVAGGIAGYVGIGGGPGFATGIGIGLGAALAYKPVIRALVNRFPSLDDKLTAQKIVRKADGSLEVRDADAESSKDEHTVLHIGGGEPPDGKPKC